MKRMLVQTQLSNYDTKGKFLLECDSGWQMCINRCREMLKLDPELHIDITGPLLEAPRQVINDPAQINSELWDAHGPDGDGRPQYRPHNIISNALVTRYDFDWRAMAKLVGQEPYTAVYINDPMHLRAFKALFHVVQKRQPKFIVHNHFIDNLECPKFPTEASLWLGQCEAAIKADVNFWQCESSMNVFFQSMGRQFLPDLVLEVAEKSQPWDDGYSATEITSPVVVDDVRFDPGRLREWKNAGKRNIFVPNRIGGRGRSSDYTNCGKFMFELLPELRKLRQDFVVIAGNPSQKFSNEELTKECGPNGYVSLVPDAFTRDEFKVVAREADIALGLYDQDSYGGTAARECVELGCMPLWLDNYEYSTIAREAQTPGVLCKPDFSDLVDGLCHMLDNVGLEQSRHDVRSLQRVVRQRCSFESTTTSAMERMGL